MSLISYDQLVDLVKQDTFILQLLHSEKVFLQKITTTQCHVMDPLIEQRLHVDHNTLITKKRETLMKLIQNIEGSLKGSSRDHVKRVMYQTILLFSLFPEMKLGGIIVGHPGTGRHLVASLYAQLYHALGILMTSNVTHQLMTHQYTNLVVLRSGLIEDPCSVVMIIYDTGHETLDHPRGGVIYLNDYEGHELGEIFEHMLQSQSKSQEEVPEGIRSDLKVIVQNNYKLFSKQALDLRCLAKEIEDDYLLAQSTFDYQSTIVKYFLKKGLHLSIETNQQNQVVLLPMHLSKISRGLEEIMMTNLMTHDQILRLVTNKDDVFIKTMIQAKKHHLETHLHAYSDQIWCVEHRKKIMSVLQQFDQNVSIETMRRDLVQLIKTIETIPYASREYIRRYFYSQIYLYTKDKHSTEGSNHNYVVVGSTQAERDHICQVIAHYCETLLMWPLDQRQDFDLSQGPEMIVEQIHIIKTQTQTQTHLEEPRLINIFEEYQGMCGLVISCSSLDMVKNMDFLCGNYLFLVPYSASEIFQQLEPLIDITTMTPNQVMHLKQLITCLVNDPDISEEILDLPRLAYQIKIDRVIHQETYDIETSIRQFLYDKGYFAHFDSTQNGGSCGMCGGCGGCGSNFYKKVRKAQYYT